MNKTNLKSYAPQARKDFIAAVTARANQLGLSVKAGSLEVSLAQTKGDVTVIAGQAWPSKVNGQREKLVERIRKDGFEHTMEAVGYTWFNRIAALRFMELHDYLGHGHRALSSTEGGLPEILTHATDLSDDLPGLNAAKVTELKLAGNRDGELYRMLLVAQCNALSRAMPFLFERIDDDSELLLPDNLLRSDSFIAKLVEAIPEEDWADVEIIGWLYQFYISEKKDQVIGKVVKSEDIPAATQLFTPNWIVQYLVQNSVGRLWLMANPQSTLAKEWPYYITPAEQTFAVQVQLDALIQTRVREDGETINPESITVLDPACGSGHILVAAYDVLKAIYLERGYQLRAIPRLILEKNLFGIDIDDRAAQMAGFAVLMKARADDNRLFRENIRINIFKLQDSSGINRNEIFENLKTYGLKKNHIIDLLDCFLNASTLGSLVRVSMEVESYLKEIEEGTKRALNSGDLYAVSNAEILLKFLKQAEVFAKKFDSLVANPPYMGGKGMNVVLKEYAKENFKNSKSDLYSMFIERGFEWCKLTGFNAQLTMQSWMFLSSFQQMRTNLLNDRTIINMAHLGGKAFTEITGDVVKTVAFVFHATHLKKYRPTFFKLTFGNSIEKCEQLLKRKNKFELTSQDEFKNIPGETIAYWISKQMLDSFSGKKIYDFSKSDGQCKTADNDKYIRCWWEVNIEKFGIGKKWLTYCKGGPFKKWYGNTEYVIDWSDEARSHYKSSERCRIVPEYLWYKEGVTWSRVASKDTPNAFRVLPKNSTFDMVGSSIFIEDKDNLTAILCLLNSKFFSVYIEILNPTIDIQVRDVRNIPFDPEKIQFEKLVKNGERLIEIAKLDWDQNEVSYEFQKPACISYAKTNLLSECWENWSAVATNRRYETIKLEESNNKILDDYFGLKNEEDFTIAIDQISLAIPDRRVDCQNLVSYAIGCKFGRYDLNSNGISYAGERGINFEASKYKLINVDPDGFVAAMENEWFENDAANSVLEVIEVIFTKQTKEDNINWIADSLGRKLNESSIETLRRYFWSEFYKNHLKKYINKPIYWNLSSGKLGAFNGFIYVHRYNDGTIPRIRSKYIIPLLTKIKNRIDMLTVDVGVVGTTSGRNKIQKELDLLNKKFGELTIYDERIRNFIDMKIQMNLDDGVRVNYTKFGKLLAEHNIVTGGDSDG